MAKSLNGQTFVPSKPKKTRQGNGSHSKPSQCIWRYKSKPVRACAQGTQDAEYEYTYSFWCECDRFVSVPGQCRTIRGLCGNMCVHSLGDAVRMCNHLSGLMYSYDVCTNMREPVND